MKTDLIYTKDDLIISKKHQHWRTWQDMFKEYKTSLSFQSLEELTHFLQTEYNISQTAVEMIGLEVTKNNADFLLLDLPNEHSGLPVITKYSIHSQEDSVRQMPLRRLDGIHPKP